MMMAWAGAGDGGSSSPLPGRGRNAGYLSTRVMGGCRGIALCTGALNGHRRATGNAAGLSALTGALHGRGHLAGVAVGSATVTAILENGAGIVSSIAGVSHGSATVAGNLGEPITLNVTPSSQATGPSVSVSVAWSLPAYAKGNNTDWIAIYHVGAADTAYLDFFYTGAATSGTHALSLSSQAAGSYEVRYLFEDQYHHLFVSSPVTLT